MSESKNPIRWRAGVLPAAMLAALMAVCGTASSSGPLDAPVSFEPRVPAAQCLLPHGLVSSKGAGQSWTRVFKGEQLYSRDLLLAIPGFKVDLETDSKAVKLTLWGNLPGLSDSPVLESSVILHDSKAYDLDFTLNRGRVVLTNIKKTGSAKIWLRAAAGAVQLVLSDPGDAVAIELYGRWPAGAAFSLKRKPGEGPVRMWQAYCLKGSLQIKAARTEWSMSAPPGPAYFHGDSIAGPSAHGPERLAKLPAWADPGAKPSPLAKAIQDMLEFYGPQLKSKDVDEVVVELLLLAEKDPDKERASMTRRLVVYGMAAEDMVGHVAAMLNASKHDDVRKTAVVALRHWIGDREGRDEKLYEIVQHELGFSKNEAEAVLQLLHSPFHRDQPETYETLIAYLKHRRQAVRELAAWHLYRLAPIGRKIVFDAAAPAAERDKAAAEWKKLIPAGELPLEPKIEPKEKPKEKPAEKPKATPREKKEKEKPTAAKTALLVVQVAADAALTFDGAATAQTGTERHFITPPLQPGRRYFYTASATWANSGATITRTRTVYVAAGGTTNLDLRLEDPGQPDQIDRSGPM